MSGSQLCFVGESSSEESEDTLDRVAWPDRSCRLALQSLRNLRRDQGTDLWASQDGRNVRVVRRELSAVNFKEPDVHPYLGDVSYLYE